MHFILYNDDGTVVTPCNCSIGQNHLSPKEGKMHSGKYGTTRMHHNGGFFGDIIMNIPNDKIEDALHGYSMVTIDFKDLRDLVFEYLRRRSIGNLQNMSPDDLDEWFTAGYENDSMVTEFEQSTMHSGN